MDMNSSKRVPIINVWIPTHKESMSTHKDMAEIGQILLKVGNNPHRTIWDHTGPYRTIYGNIQNYK